jgi:chemotaxis protein methyltransferase CheR
LYFDDGRRSFLAEVLRNRLAASGQRGPEAYLRLLASPSGRAELGELATALTVTETFFFRNPHHFQALVETVIPDCLATQTGTPRLRLLSAGCASGEEAYSIAMTLRRYFSASQTWDVSIRGVDVNPAMVAKARKGRYSSWALRETPAWALDGYFERAGDGFRLADSVLSAAAFEERNLAEPETDLWESEAFDVIFCRNILMYFVPEAATGLVARMAQALVPGGYLFLGHAETLRGLSQEFQLRHTHDTFYYQKPRVKVQAGVPKPVRGRAPVTEDLSVAETPNSSYAWMDTIHRASQRIAGLEARSRSEQVSQAAQQTGPMAASPAVSPASKAWDLGLTLELLREERFADARKALEGLPADSARDPDVMLLHAVLLTNMGRLGEAESACRQVLERDKLNAGAHYLLGLCREQAGDLPGAEECGRTAIYLDATFAMPWLHLGLLAKREGRTGEAVRHLGQALSLLAREDPARILMFGGGFGREALVGLCRAELKGSGNKP